MPLDPPPEDRDMEDRMRAVEDAVLTINTLLPGLATKEDLAKLSAELHKEINVQTWRFIGFVGLIAGLFFAAHKIWP